MASSRHLLTVAALLAATACTDFTHSNPFDPATPVTVRIAGPDTIYAIADTLRFSIVTDPVFPFPPAEWERHPASLARIGPEGTYDEGTYVYIDAGTNGSKVSVKATVGPRTASKTLVVMRPPVRFVAGQCETRAHALSARVNELFVLCARMADRNGYPVDGSPSLDPGVTVTVRDTSIVSAVQVGSESAPAVFRARRVGTTVVLFTKAALRDSVTLTVTP